MLILLLVVNNTVTLTWITNKPTSSGKCTITLPKSYTTIPCATRTGNVYSSSTDTRAIRSTVVEVTKTSLIYWTGASDKYMFIVCGI